MLYRASGHVLFVLPASGAPMPVTRVRQRDTRRAQMGRLDPHVPRPYARPDPGPPPAPMGPGPVDHASAWAMRLGRWRRVGHWWTFSADELNEILSCN